MKLCRCPVCHANIHLDALAQDEAARAMLGLLAPLDGGFGRALIAYIGLFRPEKSDLSFNRALKLTTEVMQLTANRDWLRAALEDTVTSLRGARQEGHARPLTNHNYLKKVLKSIDERAVAMAMEPEGQQRKSAVEIKTYHRPESLEETTAKHQAMMEQFRKKKGGRT